jgi:hypothetical protein
MGYGETGCIYYVLFCVLGFGYDIKGWAGTMGN